MKTTPKPSEIILMASGAVMFLFSFFAFFSGGRSSANAWSGDAGTLFMATWPALFGLIVGAGVAVTVFAEVKLPEQILTFSIKQVYFILAFTSFVIMFGYLLGGGFPDFGLAGGPSKGFGQILMLLGSVGLLAGSVMELLGIEVGGSSSSSGAGPNQQNPGGPATPF